MKTKPNNSWIPSIANAPISSRNISTSNGPTARIYHAMINTAIGDEAVVQMILDFMKTLDAKVTAGA